MTRIPHTELRAACDPAEVRRWAREAGLVLADQGSLPRFVLEEFLRAGTRDGAAQPTRSAGSATGATDQ